MIARKRKIDITIQVEVLYQYTPADHYGEPPVGADVDIKNVFHNGKSIIKDLSTDDYTKAIDTLRQDIGIDED